MYGAQQVYGLAGVTAIAGGGSSGYALRSDGTVWAWGDNAYGQLSDGSTANSTVAQQVYGLFGVTGIAAGSRDAYALKSEGAVWAWGAGGSGALGDGGTTDRHVANQVIGLPTAPTGSHVSYTYDGSGYLASRTTAAGTQQFTWDFAQAVPLLVSDGTNYYIYGPGGLAVEQVDASSGAVTYLYHDQLGSTRLLADPSGTITATYAYDPYGRLTAKTGSGSTPLGYAGQYTDAEAALVYMRARFYDPAAGQFLSVDPLQALTQQRYAYSGDNALTYTDPYGLLGGTTVLGVTIGGVVGFTVGVGQYYFGYASGHHGWSWRGAASAAVGGLVGGAATGACVGTTYVEIAACGSFGGAVATIAQNAISGKPLWNDIGQGAFFGALGSIAGEGLFHVQGMRPMKLSNLWKPGINAQRLYGQAFTGGFVGVFTCLATQ